MDVESFLVFSPTEEAFELFGRLFYTSFGRCFFTFDSQSLTLSSKNRAESELGRRKNYWCSFLLLSMLACIIAKVFLLSACLLSFLWEKEIRRWPTSSRLWGGEIKKASHGEFTRVRGFYFNASDDGFTHTQLCVIQSINSSKFRGRFNPRQLFILNFHN